jgi:membrane protein YdbS with pleckstrin-like domain
MNKSPNYDPFTKQSFVMCLVSLILNLSDYGSDIGVAILLYREENTDWWFRLTLILIIVPLVIVNLFSIFWFHQVRWLYNNHFYM